MSEEDITIQQVRMARAGLKMGVRDLAKIMDVSPNTISRFERGEKCHRRTLRDIKRTLEDAGVEFITTKSNKRGVLLITE